MANSKVLLVEDDATFAEIISESLKEAGYEVHHSADGESAVSELTTFQPGIMLLDLVLPQMGGIDVLKSLSEMTGAKPTVIVLSNLADSAQIVDALKYGANEYLIKSNVTVGGVVEKVEMYSK